MIIASSDDESSQHLIDEPELNVDNAEDELTQIFVKGLQQKELEQMHKDSEALIRESRVDVAVREAQFTMDDFLQEMGIEKIEPTKKPWGEPLETEESKEQVEQLTTRIPVLETVHEVEQEHEAINIKLSTDLKVSETEAKRLMILNTKIAKKAADSIDFIDSESQDELEIFTVQKKEKKVVKTLKTVQRELVVLATDQINKRKESNEAKVQEIKLEKERLKQQKLLEKEMQEMTGPIESSQKTFNPDYESEQEEPELLSLSQDSFLATQNDEKIQVSSELYSDSRPPQKPLKYYLQSDRVRPQSQESPERLYSAEQSCRNSSRNSEDPEDVPVAVAQPMNALDFLSGHFEEAATQAEHLEPVQEADETKANEDDSAEAIDEAHAVVEEENKTDQIKNFVKFIMEPNRQNNQFVDAEAEEEDDEFKGMGGIDGDNVQINLDLDDPSLIVPDSHVVKVNEEQVLELHRQQVDDQDKRDIEALLNDVTSGNLRKRGFNRGLDSKGFGIFDEDDADILARIKARYKFSASVEESVGAEQYADDPETAAFGKCFLSNNDLDGFLSQDEDFKPIVTQRRFVEDESPVSFKKTKLTRKPLRTFQPIQKPLGTTTLTWKTGSENEKIKKKSSGFRVGNKK